jgi:hypothetical protein
MGGFLQADAVRRSTQGSLLHSYRERSRGIIKGGAVVHTIERLEVIGSPPPWSVTGVDRFVVAVIQRAEREGGALPARFHMSMCPWGERNAVHGGAMEWHDVMDPRYRLVHFTGCGRPYLVVLLVGEGAEQRQRKAAQYLPWSEHFQVEIGDERIRLRFLSESEQPEIEPPEPLTERSLRELFRTGELANW